MIILILIFTLLWVKKLSSPFEEAIYWSIIILGVHISAFVWKIDIYTTVLWLFIIIISRLKLGNWSNPRSYLKGLILSLPFLAVASMPTRFLDAGRYYDQTVRWFQEGIPRGLANFDLFLIQASAAHSFEALGNVLYSNGQNEVVSIVSAFLIVYTFLNNGNFNIPSIIVYLIFYALLSNFFQCSSPDLIGIALITAYFFNDKKETPDYAKVFMAGVLPLIKLTLTPFSLLFLVQLISKRKLNEAIVATLFLCLAALKNFYLSGWVPVVGLFDVSWKIPQEAVNYIKLAALGLESHNEGLYLGTSQTYRLIDVFVYLVYIVTISIFFWHTRSQKLKTTAIFLIAIAILWPVISPHGRYLFPVILFALYELSKLKDISLRIHPKLAIVGIGCLALITLAPSWHETLSNPRIKRFFDYAGVKQISLYKPSPMWHIESKKIQLDDDFSFYAPIQEYECFDTDFPCNTKIIKYYGGDSIYTPVYSKNLYQFSYRSDVYSPQTKQRMKELNSLEQ